PPFARRGPLDGVPLRRSPRSGDRHGRPRHRGRRSAAAAQERRVRAEERSNHLHRDRRLRNARPRRAARTRDARGGTRRVHPRLPYGLHGARRNVGRLMEKPIVHADGSVRLRLPTPRGIVSVLALFASGLVFAVSGLTWLMGMTAPGGDVPGALTVTASLSLVALVAIAVDRAWARARGVEVRFQPAHDDAPARYSILCDRKTLEDGPLARTRLCIAPLPYPRVFAQPLFPPASCRCL